MLRSQSLFRYITTGSNLSSLATGNSIGIRLKNNLGSTANMSSQASDVKEMEVMNASELKDGQQCVFFRDQRLMLALIYAQ